MIVTAGLTGIWAEAILGMELGLGFELDTDGPGADALRAEHRCRHFLTVPLATTQPVWESW